MPLREVSRAIDIPHAFLAKIIRDLVRAGLLEAQPGSGGGLSLARPPGRTTVKDVVLAIDGPELFEECVLRLPGCGEATPCPLHGVWVPIRERIAQKLCAATLDALAEATRAEGFRLSDLGAEEL